MADADPALVAAHKHCGRHRAELAASALWGCFYCLAKYPPSPNVEWVNGGTTARCLRCGIDAVLGDAAGFPLTDDFLERMHLHWFGLGQQLDPASGEWVDVMVLSQIPKIAQRQLLPFARDLASAIAQRSADAIEEAEEELTFAMAEGKGYCLPPGRTRRGSTTIAPDAVDEWLIAAGADGDDQSPRPDTAYVGRLLEDVRTSRSASIRAIWPKWSDRWDRARRGREAVFVFTDRLLLALARVGTPASFRMYQAALLTWAGVNAPTSRA